MYFTSTVLLAFGTLIGSAQAVVKALDLSQPQGTSVWTCVQGQSFLKGVPRLYQEACGIGGRIDPNFITSYNQIRASGIKDIDGYFFPCTGSSHNCKSPQAQVGEIVDFLAANNIMVKRLWLDLEPPSAGSPCRGWNYGAAQNTALAKQFVAAIKATGLKWGVYANGNQWATMFGSRGVDIASGLPLWAVQWDGVPTLESVHTFMGGWTTAFAKQYGQSTGGCAPAGAFDLNVFTE
ncbi:Glycoside Hydrolase Family 25 protein [Tuber magnatum]|uniref:Glycoside Hydrolase Family 25 protein n=1 Tax=Tuber magnatum TaxID=42249 RepID=A0A317SBQ3_9PEZI|nr:Glycoside Hydrolase Family 25 protein [Tuber magnatum]